jgi:hypothetical protein
MWDDGTDPMKCFQNSTADFHSYLSQLDDRYTHQRYIHQTWNKNKNKFFWRAQNPQSCGKLRVVLIASPEMEQHCHLLATPFNQTTSNHLYAEVIYALGGEETVIVPYSIFLQ